jgi:hypothetical protein
MNQQYRMPQRSLFWPLIFIGVGGIWLLSNLGILSAASISVLFRLWPLILIVVGLDLLIGRNNPALGRLIALGAVALIIVLMILGPSFGMASNVEIKSGSYTEPLDDAASATINISAGIGDLKVKPLADSNALIDADIRYVGEVEFKREGTTEKFVSLSQKGAVSFGFNFFDFAFNPQATDLRWDISLSKDTPLDLTLNAGVGGSDLDLADLKLKNLKVNLGTGGIELRLPKMDAAYNVRIEAGTGGGNIHVADGAAVTLDISGGTGSFTVDVPDNAAVQLTGSTGVGDINVPSDFTRKSGDDKGVGDKGVWETSSFSSAERKIVIEFSGGVGGLTVR